MKNTAPHLEALTHQAVKAAHLLKLLANEHRLMVLCLLLEQERTVSELLECVPLSQSALSQHLSNLREANLVSCRKEGLKVFYRLESEDCAQIIATLHDIFCSHPIED